MPEYRFKGKNKETGDAVSDRMMADCESRSAENRR